jgi:hypothetical protein
MRKVIILAISLVALAVIAAPFANANVAVTDGVGFVGKGDVQNALGLHNDAAMQAYETRYDTEFAYGFTKVYDNYARFADGTEIRMDHVITGKTVVKDEGRWNGNHTKITTGWDILGAESKTITSETGDKEFMDAVIAEWMGGKGTPVELRIDHDSHSTFTADGFSVLDERNGQLIPLPNTPVEVPTV